MKITVELDDENKTEIVFQHIIDAYVMVRTMEPVQSDDGQLSYVPGVKSNSWGDLREILKELRQAVYEIEASGQRSV